MGSKITRALTRNERSSRNHSTNQIQIRQLIKLMNVGMSASALFCVAFLDPSNHIHQHQISSLMIFCIILGYSLNRTNPIFMLLITCTLFALNALLFPSLSILYNLIELGFIYVFSTLVYNYHYISTSSALKCSTVVLTLSSMIEISGKCSYELKVLRQQRTGIEVIQHHIFMIRFLFLFIGIMCSLLVVGANKHIRRYRIKPILLRKQGEIIGGQLLSSDLTVFVGIYIALEVIMNNSKILRTINVYEEIVLMMIILVVGTNLHRLSWLQTPHRVTLSLKISAIALLFSVFILSSIIDLEEAHDSELTRWIPMTMMVPMQVLKIVVISVMTNCFVPKQRVNYIILFLLSIDRMALIIQPKSISNNFAWGIVSILALMCLWTNRELLRKNKQEKQENNWNNDTVHEEASVNQERSLIGVGRSQIS